LGPEDLHQALSGLPHLTHPNLIVGMERVEDAGVYKINEDIAIVQTLDFFTPVVDDPFTFGQIAAANSLSDVYSMGGKPITAMNIVCFPVQTMDISVLQEVLRGGIEKMREAGVVLVGGHSVDDQEIKYGLSVTGTIHPQKVLTKEGSKVGNKLILTKPLGTGIISTAVKTEMASREASERIIKSMSSLNRTASEIMLEVGVDACTDITGFGLLGHACEMVEDTPQGLLIYADRVPIFPDTLDFAEKGLVPGGLYRNRDFRKPLVHIASQVNQFLGEVLFDPQTSGGLLISVNAAKADLLLQRLHQAGVDQAAIIGEVIRQPAGQIMVQLSR
jgi:selenide, water dikinase